MHRFFPPVSKEDQQLLDEKFKLMDEAHKHLIDPVTGKFRTMAEAMEIAKNIIKD